MPAGWKKMSATEITLANDWYNRDSIQPSEIARRLKRDKSVITRHVIKKIQKKKKQGRPAALSKAQVDFLEKTLNEMIVKADTVVQRRVECKKVASDAHTPCHMGAVKAVPSQCPHSALTVPPRCPHGALTVPSCKSL
jgi:hypothetical protein